MATISAYTFVDVSNQRAPMWGQLMWNEHHGITPVRIPPAVACRLPLKPKRGLITVMYLGIEPFEIRLTRDDSGDTWFGEGWEDAVKKLGIRVGAIIAFVARIGSGMLSFDMAFIRSKFEEKLIIKDIKPRLESNNNVADLYMSLGHSEDGLPQWTQFIPNKLCHYSSIRIPEQFLAMAPGFPRDLVRLAYGPYGCERFVRMRLDNRSDGLWLAGDWHDFARDHRFDIGTCLQFTATKFKDTLKLNMLRATDALRQLGENMDVHPDLTSNVGPTSTSQVNSRRTKLQHYIRNRQWGIRAVKPFTIAMTRGYLTKKAALNLPNRECWKIFGIRRQTPVFLRSRMRRKDFKATMYYYADCPTTKLSMGWPQFAKDHALRVGDKITFKLILDDPVVFNVHINGR